MEKKVIRKTKNIVITGAESSGKTTLFKELKSLTGFSFLPEFSRSYINQINRPYDYNDILEIAKLFNSPIEMLPERAGNRMTADVVTAKTEALGWYPKWSIKDYIK